MKILSFEAEFTRRHPKRVHILRLMREAMEIKEVQYSDLTLTNLELVRDLMVKRLAPNSAQVYCAILKAFLSDVSEEVELPTLRFNRVLKVKPVPSQHCCLTEDELIMFDEYKPHTPLESDAKILFMRGAFSGARASDCREMSTDNVHEKTLSYVSIKTKVGVEQPIHNRLVKYLDAHPSKEHDPSLINRTIQRICKNLGFDEEITLFINGKNKTKKKYEWITMHSARRSFCTALAVRGVPVEIIAKLAGHTDSSTTSKHYICVDTNMLGKEALGFFGNQ